MSDKAANSAPRIERGKPHIAPVSFDLEERRIWFALEANRLALRSRVMEMSREMQATIDGAWRGMDAE